MAIQYKSAATFSKTINIKKKVNTCKIRIIKKNRAFIYQNSWIRYYILDKVLHFIVYLFLIYCRLQENQVAVFFFDV
jgi:hypothetical protein